MSLASLFTRKRKKAFPMSTHTYVQGDIFGPGAEGMSYESTVGNPLYQTRVFPQWNFVPLRVTQPELSVQLLSLPSDPQQGYPFYGVGTAGPLIAPADYPSVQGDYYE